MKKEFKAFMKKYYLTAVELHVFVSTLATFGRHNRVLCIDSREMTVARMDALIVSGIIESYRLDDSGNYHGLFNNDFAMELWLLIVMPFCYFAQESTKD